MMNKRYTVGLTLVSALLFPLSMPNELFLWGSPVLALFCMAPAFLGMHYISSMRQAMQHGIIFAVVSISILYFWLLFYDSYAVWTLGGVVFVYIIWFSFFYPLCWHITRTSVWVRPFALAGIWLAFEYFKSIGYLAFPWGLLGQAFHAVTPFIQIADTTSVWGISYLVLLPQAALSVYCAHRTHNIALSPILFIHPAIRMHGIKKYILIIYDYLWGTYAYKTVKKWHILCIATLFIMNICYGYWRLHTIVRINENNDTLTVLMTQQNADPWTMQPLTVLRHNQQASLAVLQKEEILPDIIAFSEGSLPYAFENNMQYYQENPPEYPFFEYLDAINRPIITGTNYFDGIPIGNSAVHIFNSSVMIYPQTHKTSDYYAKQHLIPFAEHNPLSAYSWLEGLINFIGITTRGFTPGGGPVLFHVANRAGDMITFATPICFEDSFANITREMANEGVDIFINLTNNAWSKTHSAQAQHYASAVFRSIETRRPLVRSTNTGYSVVLNARGELVAFLPMFELEAMQVTVPVRVYSGATPYMLFGDVFIYSIIGWIIGLLFFGCFVRRVYI